MNFARLALLIITSVILTPFSNCFSQETALDQFKALTYESSAGTTLLYRELAPRKLEEGAKYPLVIFLHGAGERGDDNKAQLVHGMNDFCSARIAGEFPAYVIAPQCPREKKWVEVDWSAMTHDTPDEPSQSMAALIELIEEKTALPTVDPDRVYVTGLSMGGYGTWDLISRKPEWFAAALPVCGGGDSRAATVARFKHIPIWTVHGDADQTVPVKRSRDMIKALRDAGAEPKYSELEGVGHDSWTATYADIETYRWLFSHRHQAAE